MQYHGLLVTTDEDVYRPSDDTFLLADAVLARTKSGHRFLEVGTGTGLIAMLAARQGATVIATDVNPHACRLARANARANGLRIDVVQGDLATSVGSHFDVVAFNPPYLPTGADEVLDGPINAAFDGGLDGNAVALRFAQNVPDAALILVVHSNLSNPGPLDQAMAARGRAVEIVAEKRLPMELLTVRGYTS